jgi:plastocyanin
MYFDRMSQLRYSLSLVLLAPLILAGGCDAPKEEIPIPQPQVQAQPNSAPPTREMMGNAPTNTVPMMKPVTPPELTDEQKVELKAGEMAHKPKELTFHVNGGNFYFVPNMMKVKKGDRVKIIFENDGGFHNFVLDEFKVKIDPINTGASSTIEFVADKAGTFEYYCSVGKHREMGQKGQLIVE